MNPGLAGLAGAMPSRSTRWALTLPLGPATGRPAWEPLGWLVAFALALWPHWRWAAARLADGSDDPLGIAALAVLLAAVARLAPRLRRTPSMPWLALGGGLALAASAAAATGPALLGALLAVLAMAAALRAFLPPAVPGLALAGLAALSLPVVSSLQFYAGYPLRVVTAEVSTWLLGAAGFDAARQGSAMRVDGRLVIVDAPCSGVQMVWMAYFCACAVAWWTRLPDGRFARRVAGVGAVVLAGNVLRNSVLVGLEAAGTAPSPAIHDAVGTAVLALVCAGVVLLVGRPVADGAAPGRASAGRSDRGATQWWRAVLLAVLVACTLLPPATASHRAEASSAPAGGFAEWPREWDGRALRPLALGEVEARFAARFPGRIARLTDERSVFVWRDVTTPTRMLHPAADCFRGLGYRLDDARLERDADGRLWRAFVARRDGQRLRVVERIVGADGSEFTDASAWFWAAQLGRSRGPWQAVTIATPIGAAS